MQPVDDGVPVFRLRVVERRVVGAGREDEKVGAAASAGEEVVRHLQLEEAIAVALDDEDGEVAIAQSFAG